MDRNFRRALPHVLKHEGGFVDNPKDPGGATNKGVTLATFRRYVKANGTVAELKIITDEQVATVYYRHYWAAVQAHLLPSGLDYAMFDFAVNSGPATAAKFLQRILGVTIDGRVGPKTIAAAQQNPVHGLISQLCADRLAWLKRIKHRQTGALLWTTFGRGWQRRVDQVHATAISWVGKPADVKTVEVEREVLPPAIEESVEKETSWWQKLLAFFGFSGLGTGTLYGVDWRTLVAISAVLFIVAALLFWQRRRLLAGIREIRDGLA